MKIELVRFVVFSIFLISSCAPGIPEPTHTPSATATIAPPSPTPAWLTPVQVAKKIDFGTSYPNVHYCSAGTTPLKMTIVVPDQPLRSPAPVVIHLKFMGDLIQPLIERGFVVVNLIWREPPVHKLPIGIQEAKCAIRYLRANADFYQLDPEQIGVFGCSRGGHTAALVGVTDPSADMEGNFGFPDQSSRVQAVVMFDGIADFRTNYADSLGELEGVHGITSLDDPMISYLSPITYVDEDDPPFLAITSNDEHWKAQAKMLAEALTAQGVSATYLPAENAGHCQFSGSGPHSRENMITMIGDFFEENLK